MSALERPRREGCEPCPRPAEVTARCPRCMRDYTPARAPHGCPACWVGAMARRILGDTLRLTVVEPKPEPVAAERPERVVVEGFEQWEDDDDLPF